MTIKAMTPQQINQAIAEHLGWTDFYTANKAGKRNPHGQHLFGHNPATCEDSTFGGKEFREVPNFYGDLNACHEMEKSLKDTPVYNFWYGYFQHLSCVCGNSSNNNIRLYRCITATAPQRCEAFLRTVGKWQDCPQGKA